MASRGGLEYPWSERLQAEYLAERLADEAGARVALGRTLVSHDGD